MTIGNNIDISVSSKTTDSKCANIIVALQAAQIDARVIANKSTYNNVIENGCIVRLSGDNQTKHKIKTVGTLFGLSEISDVRI